MRDCTTFRDDLWSYLDNDLSDRARLEVEAHLAACEACRREMASRRMLWSILGDDAVPEMPDLTDRIMAQVTAEPRQPVHLHWRRWAALAVAAVLLIAVGLTVLLQQQPGPTSIQTPNSEEVVKVQAPEVTLSYLEREEIVPAEGITDIELLMYGDYVDALATDEDEPGDI